MSCLVGTWGYIHLSSRDADVALIHSEDIEPLQQILSSRPLSFYSPVYCESVYGGYPVLRLGFSTYRVRPELYHVTEQRPALSYGDTVRIKDGTERAGQVRAIIWHHKRGEYMYFLRIGGKMYSKRLWIDELEFVHTP